MSSPAKDRAVDHRARAGTARPYQSEGWPGRAYEAPSNAIRDQAQRPIESAVERKRASVGPEGRTER